MKGFSERLREAVVRISATQTKDLRFLPGLERSLVPILSVASTFYGFGTFVRRLLYQAGVLRRARLPVPVISVGNLTWGGTGKTPMVEHLARHYIAARVCPLILTRVPVRNLGFSADLVPCHLSPGFANVMDCVVENGDQMERPL